MKIFGPLKSVTAGVNCTSNIATFEGVRLLFDGLFDHLPEALGYGERQVLSRHLMRLQHPVVEEARLAEERLFVLFDFRDGFLSFAWRGGRGGGGGGVGRGGEGSISRSSRFLRSELRKLW